MTINSDQEVYQLLSHKLNFEEATSSFVELLEDVSRLYPEDDSPKLRFLDNRVTTQSFIHLRMKKVTG